MAQAIAEESQTATPTLSPATEAPAAGSGVIESDPNSSGSEKRAHHESTEPDRDKMALELLDGGGSVDEAKKAFAAAQPAANSKRQTPGAGESKSTPLPKSPDEAESASGTAGEGGHDGLDSKTKQILSQTHLLPPVEHWNQASAEYRASLVQSAKELLASRSREFQRQRNERGQFAPVTAQDEVTQQAAPLQESLANPHSPPAGTQAQGQDVRAQPPPSQGTGNGANPPPDDLMQPFNAFADQLEDEKLSKPFKEGFSNLIGQVQNAFAQQQQAFMAELQRRDQQLGYLAKRTIGREEAQARETLAREIPELTPPPNSNGEAKAAAKALWDEVLGTARVFFQASLAAGQEASWEDSLLMAGRSRLSPNIQTNAQRALMQTRKETLQGSGERSGAVAKPNREMSKDDRDAYALQALDAGKTPEQVKSEFM